MVAKVGPNGRVRGILGFRVPVVCGSPLGNWTVYVPMQLLLGRLVADIFLGWQGFPDAS